MADQGEMIIMRRHLDTSQFFEGFLDAARAVRNGHVSDRAQQLASRDKKCGEGDQYSCGAAFALSSYGTIEARLDARRFSVSSASASFEIIERLLPEKPRNQ